MSSASNSVTYVDSYRENMPMSVTAYRGDEQRGHNGNRQEPSFLETIIKLSRQAHAKAEVQQKFGDSRKGSVSV